MKKPKKRRPVWAWDIESTDWDQPIAVCAVSEHGDEIKIYGRDCLPKMAQRMKQIKGSWVAHAGGIYDTLLMLRHIQARSLIVTGTTVLSANFGHLKLRDSFPWWLCGLAKVGKAVGQHKMDVDRRKIHELTQTEVMNYCLSDCEILMKGIAASFEYLESKGAERRWTAGGSAVSLLKALEPTSAILMRQLRPDVDEAQSALQAVKGGRVECWARGHVDRVFSYDFKSSYPARYFDDQIGLGLRPVKNREDRGIYFCRWHWPHRDRIPPALDSTTQGGFGWCDGWLVDCEIAAFEEAGADVEVGHGFAPMVMAPVGHVFARDLYSQKEGGGINSFFSKVFLNSLHGKLQENPYKCQWTRDRPKTWIGPDPERLGPYWRSYKVSVDKENRSAWNTHPVGAAQILARARVALWRVFRDIEKKGGRVFYCDTDSIHTNLSPEQMGTLGHSIGDLALESGPTEAIYLGPKSYLLHRDGEIVKSALKGFPFKELKSATKSGRTYTLTDHGGFDYRVEVFEKALRAPITVERESLSTFITGINSNWAVSTLSRTLSTTGRGKRIGPDGFEYLSPKEMGHNKDPLIQIDEDPWDFYQDEFSGF
jgi:hypothetical protein